VLRILHAVTFAPFSFLIPFCHFLGFRLRNPHGLALSHYHLCEGQSPVDILVYVCVCVCVCVRERERERERELLLGIIHSGGSIIHYHLCEGQSSVEIRIHHVVHGRDL